jgi:hypothetical protein
MNWRKLLLTTAAAAAISAGALNAAHAGFVDVPFDFTYQNTKMPAGRYYYRYTGSPSAVLLTNMDTRSTILVTIQAGGSWERLKLVFDERDGERVLRPVR